MTGLWHKTHNAKSEAIAVSDGLTLISAAKKRLDRMVLNQEPGALETFKLMCRVERRMSARFDDLIKQL